MKLREISVKQNNSDQELEIIVIKAIKGDREALISLCKSIAGLVLFRTTYFIKNTQDAEDAAQEVLIRVCEKIHTLREPKTFKAWLNTIVQNETNRFMSKNAKHNDVINVDDYIDTQFEDDDDFLPEEYVLVEEDRKAIMDIINTLPDRQREVVFLHYYEGQSITETANTLKITISAVSHYLRLARNKIQNEMERHMEKTGTLFSVMAFPLGAVIKATMRHEASQMSEFGGNILGGMPLRTSAIAGISIGVVKTAIVTIAITITLVGAVLGYNRIFGKDKEISTVQQISALTNGQIVFSGSDSDINPTSVSVQAENEHGALEVSEWKIVKSDSRETIYSSKNETADGTLMKMQSNGEKGEYFLSYTMIDMAGCTFEVSRKFIIK